MRPLFIAFLYLSGCSYPSPDMVRGCINFCEENGLQFVRCSDAGFGEWVCACADPKVKG